MIEDPSQCANLHQLLRGRSRHKFPPPFVQLPLNGIYFIFEVGHRSRRLVGRAAHPFVELRVLEHNRHAVVILRRARRGVGGDNCKAGDGLTAINLPNVVNARQRERLGFGLKWKGSIRLASIFCHSHGGGAATELLKTITPAKMESWAQSRPMDWANESFAIAEQAQTRYCLRQGALCDQPAEKVKIDGAYVAANAPIVRERLQKAGVRLAHLLDVALRR